MEKVLLGMSGGVDSTVSAALLAEKGYAVQGVFFLLNEAMEAQLPAARQAARDCGVPLLVQDLKKQFSETVECPFVSEYLSGRTPNPCVLCNRAMKFPALLAAADACGAAFIATGHYAGVRKDGDSCAIVRGKDRKKDQSYFLYGLGQKVLSRLLLPLSGMTKEEVRAYAAARGISAASRSDSQDICFIPDGDSGAFVEARAGAPAVPGIFQKTDGTLLGQHRGIFRYTVGQRRGLGIAADAPLYVTRIDTAANRIVLGYENELYTDKVHLCRVFFPGPAPAGEFVADVCIRYSKNCYPARLVPGKDGYTAFFETPQRAPAPGQSAVFYSGDTVLGGGIIRAPEENDK